MRKLHLVCLIVVGIAVNNLHSVNGCKDRRLRRHQKEIAALNDNEKGSPVDLPYNNANIPDCDSIEADYTNPLSDLVKGITLDTSRKFKRNSPDFLTQDIEDSKNLNNEPVPNYLLTTLASQDDNTEPPPKFKRTISKKSRRPRDKKFTCLCEETKCRNNECLQNQKFPLNSLGIAQDDDEDTSAEELDDANVIQQSISEPKKFSIPFANNVNFDQRVIVGAKPKAQANTFYPVYANPQIYQYTPYTIAHPGVIYTGVAPLQQSYAPAATYNQLPSPSPIPAHLLKMWKNGVQNPLLPVNNNPQPSAEYVPNYSSENTKNPPEIPGESAKVTTPRQVDNSLYPQINPAYGYSTDYPYNQHYTTEVISADMLKFLSEKPKEAKPMDFGDPKTMNYAPNYYTNSNPNSGYPGGNQNVPQYDYNGLPISTSPPGFQPHEDAYDPESDELSIEFDKMIDAYKNNAPTMMSVPNDEDLPAYNPPQTQAPPRVVQQYNRPPDFGIQPPASYNIEKAYQPQVAQGNTEIYSNVPQRATTLEDVNNGYASHYNPQKTATLRDANDYNKNDDKADKDHMENLFRGLEKILLNNVNVSDTPQTQAVDERPSTTYETPRNPMVQNAVTKVLNNFVPGKSEDLLANYGTERSTELARENGESLSPDLVNAQLLKNLLNVPEVENMIVETTKNLIHQVSGSQIPDNVIKDTLKNVVNDIPRPTSPPPPKRNTLNFQIRLSKRVPRYDDSANREVFEKIKNIIDKSELGEEAVNHPLAQNVIVKAVKHSIDKEKGAADEATIRRAFNQLVKSKKSNDNYKNGPMTAEGRPLIVQPKETVNSYGNGGPRAEVYTTEDTGYKLAPAVPVKERRLQGGVWVETPKNIVGNRAQGKLLEEKKRKELEKQLDMLQQYNQPINTTDASTERVGAPYYTTPPQKSDVSTRQTAQQFYEGAPVTVDPKTAQYNPQNNGYNNIPQGNGYNNVPQGNGYNNVPRGNAYNNVPQGTSYNNLPQGTSYNNVPQGNGYNNVAYPNNNPVVTTINYDYRNPSYTTQPPNNHVNLLVDSTQSPILEQKADEKDDPAYMGRLVPVNTNSVNGDMGNSNLVWVGDGVRLPLTMRKMQDGTYALTLSDEVCKMFVHKKCPCCLPNPENGMIVRERRNDERDFTDDGRSGKKFKNEISGNYRVRRDSGEVTTFKTISNAIGKHQDFKDADYDASGEDNSMRIGAPYKYQRYANQDRMISGRTRALGNMLKWMKDVVTEANDKRQRRRV